MPNITIPDYINIKNALFFIQDMRDTNTVAPCDAGYIDSTIKGLQKLIQKLEKEED